MAQFDVFTNPIADQRRRIPYWLDIQSDFLHHLQTRVIIPLARVSEKTLLIERLNPTFEIQGNMVYADTANMVPFPVRLLRQPLASLRPHSFQILAAFDFLISGI
jgi:toxin CcdB